MKSYGAEAIRNVAILGHTGSGKTTIVESALNIAGLTSRFGRVEDGNTVSDHDAEEIRRKISIGASMIPIEWKDGKINFIDTPGFFDFYGEVHQALRVADIALIVVNAKSGVEVGTEKAWELAEAVGLPKMIFLNNMDDENVDFDKLIEQLKEKFGKCIAPLQLPIKEGGKFVGYVNAIKKEGRKYTAGGVETCAVPADLEDEVNKVHHMIEEAVAETDDDLMEKFFMEEPFTRDEIYTGIGKGIASAETTPVILGSAVQSMGVGVLMDNIKDFCPPSSELTAEIVATDAKSGEEVKLPCKEDGPPVAFVFKTIADNFGKLSIFRVYSGVFKKETPLYNSNKEQSEKIAQLFVIRGKEQIPVNELKAGDIGAIAKLQHTSTGDTLCTKENAYILPPVNFPAPLYAQGVVPKNKGDEDKISQAVARFLEEDKTLSFKVDPETKQIVISGLGDNHLDVIKSKMAARNKLEVEFMPLIVPYREMIKGKAEVEGTHKKQSGGAGQFGKVKILFEPSGDLSKAYEFESKVVGGSVGRNFWPAVEKGIAESCKAGPLAGYPVVGLKATLLDGKEHAVDSNELSFSLAATIAFKEAFPKAKPVILEPIMKTEITVPDDYTGDIMGDINKKGGRVLGMAKVGAKQVISAQVPYAKMTTYSIDLRSMTQGRGEYTMEFDSYEEASNETMEKVIEARKGA
ncbi:MAG: elongation factor G [Clostridiales bacterium]|jgi:elongation factor G|nr:elongation factor G [Clostridiales bacterium]